MKILWRFALPFFLLAVVPLSAKVQELPETSGNAFLRLCSAIEKEDDVTQAEMVRVASCIGYVVGIMDGVLYEHSYAETKTSRKIPSLYCIPDVEHGQLIRVVLKYIRDNPAEANMPTGALVVNALTKAYPCPSK